MKFGLEASDNSAVVRRRFPEALQRSN